MISRLASELQNALLIGKAEKGSNFEYHIPNSPTRVKESDVRNRDILHRTAAGAKGILLAQNADIILATSFGNADATVRYIQTLTNPQITLLPMGHEATTPSLEDQVCALYLKALINDEIMNLNSFLIPLKEGSGRYFFSKDQWQYPSEDFERCLKTNRFKFAIRASLEKDHAILTRCN